MPVLGSWFQIRGGFMEVIKRDGRRVPFDKSKISIAILKAMNSSSGIFEECLAEKIADEIE